MVSMGEPVFEDIDEDELLDDDTGNEVSGAEMGVDFLVKWERRVILKRIAEGMLVSLRGL